MALSKERENEIASRYYNYVMRKRFRAFYDGLREELFAASKEMRVSREELKLMLEPIARGTLEEFFKEEYQWAWPVG